MLTIYGYSTFNPLKVVATAEELGLDYEYKFVDLGKRENASPEYQAKHPFGKVPVLEVDGHCISESAAICRYLARSNGNRLYSDDLLKAAGIDALLDTMSIHIGRWLAVYFWEEIICPKFFDRAADDKALAEAGGWLEKQLPVIDKRLDSDDFLCGNDITIADPFALSYFMIHEQTSIDLTPYANIQRWYQTMMQRPAIQKANATVFRHALPTGS